VPNSSDKNISRANSICESIFDRDLKLSCLGQVNSDKSFCNKIFSSNETKRNCLESVAQKNPECLKDDITCIISSANNEKDCDSIEGNNLQLTCRAVVSDNQSSCYEIKNSTDKNMCLARLGGSQLFCNNIKDKDIKDDCRIIIARFNNQLSLCDEISSDKKKDKCLLEMAVQTLMQ